MWRWRALNEYNTSISVTTKGLHYFHARQTIQRSPRALSDGRALSSWKRRLPSGWTYLIIEWKRSFRLTLYWFCRHPQKSVIVSQRCQDETWCFDNNRDMALNRMRLVSWEDVFGLLSHSSIYSSFHKRHKINNDSQTSALFRHTVAVQIDCSIHR